MWCFPQQESYANLKRQLQVAIKRSLKRRRQESCELGNPRAAEFSFHLAFNQTSADGGLLSTNKKTASTFTATRTQLHILELKRVVYVDSSKKKISFQTIIISKHLFHYNAELFKFQN